MSLLYLWQRVMGTLDRKPNGPDDPSEYHATEDDMRCSGCGATAVRGTKGWKTTDAHWCPKCGWLA